MSNNDMAGVVRFVSDGSGKARRVQAGKARSVAAWLGSVWLGSQGTVRPVSALLGRARCGRLGMAGLTTSWFGSHGGHGAARCGWASQVAAGHGQAGAA